MNTLRPMAISAVALLVAASLTGCDTFNSLYPVRGRVLFNGKPMMGGGTISFIPVNEQGGKGAGGEIAEDGTYQLTTSKPGDGCRPGEYRVMIHQSTSREPQPTPDGTKAPEQIWTVSPAERIPLVYSDPVMNTLTATVEAKSSNEIDFDLKPSSGARENRENHVNHDR